jgi:predicted GTPase
MSSAHGDNVSAVAELALSLVPAAGEPDEAEPAADGGAIKVAVIGRPNVGKSTLVNTLLGEERVIAFDEPGTTRDSIYLEFERNGRHYTLIDTAGVRRRGKVLEAVEKFLVIERCRRSGRERRGAAVRRRTRDLGAGRPSGGIHPRGGPGAGRRRQQMGRGARRSAR